MGFPILLGLLGLKCACDLLSINAILRSVPRWPPGYHGSTGEQCAKGDQPHMASGKTLGIRLAL